jgi:ATP-dependent RNA helicase RhlE
LTLFSDLDLIPPLQRALTKEGYERPTPIQAQAIPPLLDGRDVLGCAQTGTGKTAAFTLPVLQHLDESRPPRGKRPIRALVLTPTRELAAQIGASVGSYGRYLKLRHTVIFGGVKANPQIRDLRAGIDMLIATPGRLLDLMGQGHLSLREVEFFVLDEADRMLDMGFIHDVRRVLAELPSDRQNLLFSATMPPRVVELASSFLHEPVSVEVTPTATTVETIDQSVRFVERTDKPLLLIDLLQGAEVQSAIVFTRTKHGANRLTKKLDRAGVEAAAIHGNKSQAARTRALAGFRKGTVRVLVATDIAARGLDVDDVTHVFNYDLPNEPESYVHRIGRTARAGRDGVAISFCDASETDYLRDIERLTDQSIPVVEDHPYHAAQVARSRGRGGKPQAGGAGRRGSRGGSRQRDRRSEGRPGPRRGRGRGGARSGGGETRRSNTRDARRGGGSRRAPAQSERGAESSPRSGGSNRGSTPRFGNTPVTDVSRRRRRHRSKPSGKPPR